MSTIRVLVTAGGTREAIDDVRVVSNLSTGRFGIAIAQAFADLGCTTTLLGSTKVNDVYKRGKLDPRLEFIPFDSFQDLKAKLETQSQERYDYVLMAAATREKCRPVRKPQRSQ
ncbi:MAG: phosphopantothenoylcysteine decarboxylase [Planctomycetota bacterium]|nr:phosphopantothenoylcysteine decarboxylase [Planctomycetota bacterium]